MTHQSDYRLNKKIQASGCYFLSLLHIVQIESRYVFSYIDINELYDECLEKGYIDKNCTILKPDHVLKQGFEKLKIKMKIYQIGVIEPMKKESFWGWVTDNNKDYEWVIKEVITSGKYGSHFILCDKDGHTFYDPLLGKGYNKIDVGRCLLYKIF